MSHATAGQTVLVQLTFRQIDALIKVADSVETAAGLDRMLPTAGQRQSFRRLVAELRGIRNAEVIPTFRT